MFLRTQLKRLRLLLLFTMSAMTAGCSDGDIVERLQTLTGNEYLALSKEERAVVVSGSLDRFTTWKFWERPEICESLLNETSIAELFDQSAEVAGENLLMFSFAVLSNEECIAREEVFK